MKPNLSDREYDELKRVLLPVLADVAVGKYAHDVPILRDASHELNRILVGVQILLEVVREQHVALARSEAETADVQRRTTEILARVLDRTLPQR
jgi:hypothetical protein